MRRSKRKEEHLKYALLTSSKCKSRFGDVTFVHNSLPNTSVHSVELHHKIGELFFSSPIFINAMTGGGGQATYNINKQLGIVAKETNIPIAVGSQTAALRDQSERKTFTIIREKNDRGLIFSNIGMDATIDEAVAAVEMIDADALQIHLNVVQELTMPEGDRQFTNIINKLEQLVAKIKVPIIVKEVGYGMSRETVQKLKNVGISAVDVSGYGGTNFSKIENKRRERPLEIFNEWGIPTTVSIVEAKSVTNEIPIIASGGITNSLDIAKCIGLGADCVGIAGYFLKILVEEGVEQLIFEIEEIRHQLKLIMVALGANNISELQNKQLIISGMTHHWLTERKIDTTLYCNRS